MATASKRITKTAVKEAANRFCRTRANYHPNDLTVARAEIAYHELRDAYRKQELHARLVKVDVSGSIVTITPKSDDAREWIDSNVHIEDWQRAGEGFCVEPRYAVDLLQDMAAELIPA